MRKKILFKAGADLTVYHVYVFIGIIGTTVILPNRRYISIIGNYLL